MKLPKIPTKISELGFMINSGSKFQKIKGVIKFVFGVPLTIVALYFIASFIYRSRTQLVHNFTHVDPLGVAAGTICLLAFFFFRSMLWKSVLHQEGYKTSTLESTYLLASSELKRYIPGSVLAIAGRISNFNNLKIPSKTVVRMVFYESVLFVITSIILSIPGILDLASRNGTNTWTSTGIGILTLFVLGVAYRVLQKKIKRLSISFRKYLNAFILMCIAWLFFGLGNFLILSSFHYLNPANIISTSSFFVLSWFVGYIVVIAPLGLGVREGFLTYALSFTTPLGIAAALSIISRLAFVFTELIFLIIAYILHRLIKLNPKPDAAPLVLFISITSYILYFTYVSFMRYTNFFTGRFDLGNMDQTVWNTLHGRIFELTNPDGVEITSRLAFHSDFLLILLAPFYALWEDPRMLLLIQTVVIALGAYFVYKIAENVLRHKYIALVFGVSYLLDPFVQKQNLFDFHAVTLATTFLLAAFYFVIKKKYLPATLFIILSAITKEEAFAVAGIMFAFIGTRSRKVFWFVLSIASFIGFYLLLTKFIPDARGGQHFATEYFQDFGDTPPEIVKNILFNPAKTSAALLTAANLEYIFKLLLPTGFLSLLAPLYFILGAPDIAINLLSKNDNFRSLTFHYAATIIPFIYISSIYGAKMVLSLKNKYATVRNVSIFILVFSFVSAYFYGTLPGAKSPSLEIYNDKLPNSGIIEEYLSRIPQNLSVAASNNIGSHLSHREKIYTIPNGIDQADVVVLLLNDSFAQPSLDEQKKLAARLKKDARYKELFESGDFIAFAKIEKAQQVKKK
ncbi:MAG TPA: DUF2079 domain-containing protein [Patescibacteria group bacterium]|nr:DUF2079 domain-containing protein [Patescibacteria group bacterium]